jgi:(4S)-4-hydroxy-5-phosphonooxypentane-2,3-dione isomerase
MSRLALMVNIEIEPAMKVEVLRALLAHRDRCLRDEPGTLQFEVLVPAEDPSRIFLFELYASSDAYQAHAQGASIATYRAAVGSKITKITAHKCALGNELRA